MSKFKVMYQAVTNILNGTWSGAEIFHSKDDALNYKNAIGYRVVKVYLKENE